MTLEAEFYPVLALRSKTRDTESQRDCVEPLTAFPTLVCQVYGNPAVPTAIGLYYSVHPVDVSGGETEGGSGTLETDTSRTLLVDVIGPKPALASDYLVCRFVGNRWVAERTGKGQNVVVITVPGCPCAQSPVILNMHSSKPSSNNQMFQNATIAYGPTPSSLLPVIIQPSSYLSTTTFPDPILGVPFYYFLTCYFGGYVLTRVYPNSPMGSPFRDAIRYTWIPGFPGNTCTPFLLSNGQIYNGGDRTCLVTISQ